MHPCYIWRLGIGSASTPEVAGCAAVRSSLLRWCHWYFKAREKATLNNESAEPSSKAISVMVWLMTSEGEWGPGATGLSGDKISLTQRTRLGPPPHSSVIKRGASTLWPCSTCQKKEHIKKQTINEPL